MDPGGPATAQVAGTQNSATVVLSQRVRPEHTDDYAAWQQDVTGAVRHFDGFEGTEVFPPVPRVQEEWVVLFRFDTTAHLMAWLDSPQRQEMLDRGADFFDGPATQQVLAGGAKEDTTVTAVVSHRVKPGREKDFLHLEDRLDKAQRQFPGSMGSELFRPVPGVQTDWTVVFRFDSQEHLDAWIESDERRSLLQSTDCLTDYDIRTVGDSFGSWFRFTDAEGGKPPPNWKQAAAVLLALYPTVMALVMTLGAWLDSAGVPIWLTMFVSNVASIAVLTWLLMPVVNRVLGFWLSPQSANSRRADLLGVVLVAAGYAAFLCVFAWLLHLFPLKA